MLRVFSYDDTLNVGNPVRRRTNTKRFDDSYKHPAACEFLATAVVSCASGRIFFVARWYMIHGIPKVDSYRDIYVYL